MKEQISEDSLVRTIAACAWLVDIAQRSVDVNGWDPLIVRYLEQLGQGAFEAQQSVKGGMGVVTPMERSGTVVEGSAHLDAYRVTRRSSFEKSASRHAKQVSLGRQLLQ